MNKIKKFCICFIIALSSVTVVQADTNLKNNEPVVYEEDDGGYGEDSTDPDIGSDILPDSGNSEKVQEGSSQFIGAMGDVFDDLGNMENVKVMKATSKAANKPTQFLIQLFLGAIPAVITLITLADLVALTLQPLREILGAEQSGGGMGGNGGMVSSSRLKNWRIVSKDCIDAISICEGGGMGGASGAMGGTMGGGMSGTVRPNIYITYFKFRLITLVAAFVCFALLVTPMGFNIVMMFVEFLLNLVGKGVGLVSKG